MLRRRTFLAFGNSDVDRDILKMIGAKPDGADGYYDEFSDEQRDYAMLLYHTKLIPYLRESWESRLMVRSSKRD